MASYKKFDPRLESLVIETRTLFEPDIEEEIRKLDQQLDANSGDRGDNVDTHFLLAEAAHRSPEKASSIFYERAHTGFTREITITRDDLERIFYEVQSAGS